MYLLESRLALKIGSNLGVKSHQTIDSSCNLSEKHSSLLFCDSSFIFVYFIDESIYSIFIHSVYIFCIK